MPRIDCTETRCKNEMYRMHEIQCINTIHRILSQKYNACDTMQRNQWIGYCAKSTMLWIELEYCAKKTKHRI